MRGGAFCVPAKREGAMIQWLNGTELTNIFWFSIHFWKGAIRLKRAQFRAKTRAGCSVPAVPAGGLP